MPVSGKENNIMSLLYCGIPLILIFILIAVTIGIFCRKFTKVTETVTNAYTWLAIASLVLSIYSAYDRFIFGPSAGSFWKDPLAALIGVIAFIQIGKTGGKGRCIALGGAAIGTLFFLLNAYTILMVVNLDW